MYLTIFLILDGDTWTAGAALHAHYHQGNDEADQQQGSNHAPNNPSNQWPIALWFHICTIFT